MQSFRTELELVNHSTKALVEKDIIELDKKIKEYHAGKLPDEKFRSLRLARGVYGQRQQGVQMIRIKLPFGKVSTKQLLRIANISDEYSNGNLHLTTRQDIQIHHVSLDRTPELWAKLEQDDITLREACGNTVRNVTASAEAGIDPNEPFDVSPYAHAVFSYFLRKPFGQELGRKIKIAFSNSDKDTAVTYIHDIGFIPKINAQNERGFKVLIGGGLGAQPFLAQVAYEFLQENKLIPFIESSIRVFDRYGERVSRHKARIKYLINKIGVEAFLNLIKEEEKALLNKTVEIDLDTVKVLPQLKKTLPFERPLIESEQFVKWLKTNTFKQKQKGYHGVYVKIQLGNISSSKTRDLIQVIEQFALSSDVRLTINQGVLLKYVSTEELPFLFEALNKLNLASVGFDSVADITACPGTDTCNLAISNSTNISVKLEEVIYNEFPDLIYDRDIKIKISGCMNSCGQHGLAQIGFHGSSFKVGTTVVPALQVLLGGGTLGDGKGRIAEKVIKVASKRAPDVLRSLFNDFEKNASDGEYFNSYYDRKGKDYFYQLLKPIGDNSNLTEDEFYDWGSEERFKTEIGVGECAGVIIDLVQTLFFEAEEKLAWSAEAFDNKQFGDSIYYSYAAFIHAAKGLLLNGGFHVNTHHALINDFEKQFVETGSFVSFKELVLQINKNEPSEEFAAKYFNEAKLFLNEVKAYREKISANTFETVK
ncbi:MAG: HEPN domain-containing protein [Bacteroidetes bacterium]|nr:HEPN domain-containing protein [Bacteroidota bacterium]MCA6444021.1 HEPN domain-containing protein [Bacteroidota bacterium]